MLIGLLIKIPEGVRGCPKGNSVALQLLKEWTVTYNSWKRMQPSPNIGDDFNNCVWLMESDNRSITENLPDLFRRLQLSEFVALVVVDPYRIVARGEAIGELDFAFFLERLNAMKETFDRMDEAEAAIAKATQSPNQ